MSKIDYLYIQYRNRVGSFSLLIYDAVLLWILADYSMLFEVQEVSELVYERLTLSKISSPA